MAQIWSSWPGEGWEGSSGMKGALPCRDQRGGGLETRGYCCSIGWALAWKEAHHCWSAMVKLRLFAARERQGSLWVSPRLTCCALWPLLSLLKLCC